MPLNGPVGEWIHWQDVPEVAIRDVQLAHSGASDLPGPSAIGGMINVIPSRPTQNQIEASSSYGGDGAFEENLLAGAKQAP